MRDIPLYIVATSRRLRMTPVHVGTVIAPLERRGRCVDTVDFDRLFRFLCTVDVWLLMASHAYMWRIASACAHIYNMVVVILGLRLLLK